MKNFEITYKNGLLIDKQSGKRLNLKPFETYYLIGDNDSFLLEDYVKTQFNPLDSNEKLEALKKKHRAYELERLATSGDKFVFRIGLGKRFEEDEVREYLFDAILREDLYMKTKHNQNTWSLCNCVCKSSTLIEGYLGFPYQTVQANSLSELFANVVATYFNMKRSTACNAFDTFFMCPDGTKPDLDWLKQNKNLKLDVKRKAIIDKRKDQRNRR